MHFSTVKTQAPRKLAQNKQMYIYVRTYKKKLTNQITTVATKKVKVIFINFLMFKTTDN